MSGSTSTATGQFQTVNGQIIGPNGAVYTARGINVFDQDMGDASQILSDFPGLNFIRLNVYSYQSPSAYASFIQTMSSHGVVVELEDHTNSTGANAGGAVGSAFSGAQLSNELNWYSSMASAYASNPYVWFGTDNEPPVAGLSTWEQETYNAIRGTGNNNPIMMELPGGGLPNESISQQGMDPSVYNGMTNIIADAHFYGWSSNFSTDQQTVDSALSGIVQGAQTMQSASGTVPVVIAEYGISTNGATMDPNASEVEQALQTSSQISGSAAWNWSAGTNTQFNLSNGQGGLTAYGQEVADSFNSNAASAPTSYTTAASVTAVTSNASESANDTTVSAGSTAAITDANGNTWTITSGDQLAVDGSIDPTTANVAELAYVNGAVWQENSNDLWWNESSSGASSGTSTSPLSATASSTTVSQSNISVAATSGTNMLLISGSNDSVNVSGGTNTVTDTGSGNTYILPSAGNGMANFANDILSAGDTVDLTTALAATDWNGSSSTLSNYVTVSDTSQGAVISVASTAGGSGTAIASISGETNLSLNSLLAHSIT